MGNIKRYYDNNFAYFVTSVTFKRAPIFSTERTIDLLLLTIEYFKITLDYKLLAYCILPEHIHLIIQPFGRYDLSYILKMIKGTFARRFNKVYNSTGRIWQKRFYEQGVRDEMMLIYKMEYIHNNPIKHKLVTDLTKFKYSSYQYYINNKIHILNIDTL